MRFMLYALVSLAAAEPQTKAKSETKAEPQAKREAGTVQGFAVAPMVLKDEGCARDYVRAFQFEGVELRKRLAELNTYGCIDTTATGIFAGVATERKDLGLEKGTTAYFRKVVIRFDPKRTETAVGGGVKRSRPKPIYLGWIPEADFYAVSPERFDELLAQKKIPMTIRQGR